jgi:hypothetical protein
MHARVQNAVGFDRHQRSHLTEPLATTLRDVVPSVRAGQFGFQLRDDRQTRLGDPLRQCVVDFQRSVRHASRSGTDDHATIDTLQVFRVGIRHVSQVDQWQRDDVLRTFHAAFSSAMMALTISMAFSGVTCPYTFSLTSITGAKPQAPKQETVSTVNIMSSVVCLASLN